MPTRRDFARSFTALDDVFGFVQPLLGGCGVAQADAYAVIMAIEELFTNMVKYNAAGGGSIGIEIACDAEAIRCRVIDPDSDRFDPSSAPEPDIRAPAELRRPGGLGIHLVRCMVDSLDYDHSGRCSTVSFRRMRSAPVATDAGAADAH
jgi:serine/threonine-protein kinase RsbW